VQRVRAVDAFVMWTLSILLAGIFLLAGVPKVIGSAPVGFQAAAMHGFPTGIRVVIGIAEVLCAIGLLIPSLATVSAACLALLMIPAAATQYVSGEAGLWVPLVVLLLLVFVAWRRNAKWVYEGYHGFADVPHPMLKEGVIAGLIGAAVIAVWFGILDTVAGHPFFTPATLGRGLISVFGAIEPDQGMPTFVLTYTVFHFAAFMIVGLVASLIVHLARQEPSILLGFAILFAATEVGIYGLVAFLGEYSPLGRMAWLPIMVGNILAAAAMGYYFWRRHGELAHELRHAFDVRPEPGDEEDVVVVAVESDVGGVSKEEGGAAPKGTPIR
jgi:putative oxidoreductase